MVRLRSAPAPHQGVGLPLSVPFKRGAAIHPRQVLYHANKMEPEKRSSSKSTALRNIYSLANGGQKEPKGIGKEYTTVFLHLHTAKLNGTLSCSKITPHCRFRLKLMSYICVEPEFELLPLWAHFQLRVLHSHSEQRQHGGPKLSSSASVAA